jgi:hypothetical protein
MQHNRYKTGMKLDLFLIVINNNWVQFDDDIFLKRNINYPRNFIIK